MLAFGLLAACSGFTDKNGAEDAREGGMAAALEKALAEAESGENEGETSKAGSEEATLAQSDTGSPDVSEDEDLQSRALSTEPLRAGLPISMGSAHFMCQRTLSIVGEHCGCMVNRATDAGISDARQARLFGGRAGNATADQIEKFTRIVRSCSGYNVTIRGEPKVADAANEASPAAPEASAGAKGRIVSCEFSNPRYGYKGDCRFVPRGGGDFEATALEGNYFEDVARIDLDVTGRGVGRLVINYSTGPVSVPVTRETRDKACWSNMEVRFCAR
ncbi:MAG: hypothetical protein AAFQ13_01435 [Pseudomonadota bacterium]